MRHIINILALTLGIAAALAVCGCCAPSANGAGLRADVGIGLPPLGQLFTGPPKPICIPDGHCVAAYGDGWKMLGPCPKDGATAQPMVYMPMYADTAAAILRGAPQPVSAEVEPEPAQVGEYPKVLRRIVTEYEGGIPGETTATPEPAAAGDCP